MSTDNRHLLLTLVRCFLNMISETNCSIYFMQILENRNLVSLFNLLTFVIASPLNMNEKYLKI